MSSPAPAVLLAVASELAKQAKSNMPELRDGERIRREWYKDDVFYRGTTLDGDIFLSQYSFRLRKSRRVAVVK